MAGAAVEVSDLSGLRIWGRRCGRREVAVCGHHVLLPVSRRMELSKSTRANNEEGRPSPPLLHAWLVTSPDHRGHTCSARACGTSRDRTSCQEQRMPVGKQVRQTLFVVVVGLCDETGRCCNLIKRSLKNDSDMEVVDQPLGSA